MKVVVVVVVGFLQLLLLFVFMLSHMGLSEMVCLVVTSQPHSRAKIKKNLVVYTQCPQGCVIAIPWILLGERLRTPYKATAASAADPSATDHQQ